jgi:hypothetical protein
MFLIFAKEITTKNLEIMKITKETVKANLILKGNNVDEVTEMVDLHFDIAIEKCETLKTVCRYIRNVY